MSAILEYVFTIRRYGIPRWHKVETVHSYPDIINSLNDITFLLWRHGRPYTSNDLDAGMYYLRATRDIDHVDTK